eukprot:511198_1
MSRKRKLVEANECEKINEPPSKKHKSDNANNANDLNSNDTNEMSDENEWVEPKISDKNEIINVWNNKINTHKTNWIQFLSDAIGNQMAIQKIILNISEYYSPPFHLQLSPFPECDESY